MMNTGLYVSRCVNFTFLELLSTYLYSTDVPNLLLPMASAATHKTKQTEIKENPAE
jgi:hypothetical protein